MNKAELEKEAEEYARENDICVCGDEYWSHNDIKQAYLAGAEPREKQIQIDAEQIIALQKQNGELTDKVKELEAQIEKMKLCQICKYYQWESCSYHSLWEKDCKANNHKLFELVGDNRKNENLY